MHRAANFPSHRRSPFPLAAIVATLLASLAGQQPTALSYTVHATDTKATAGVIPLEVELTVLRPTGTHTVFEIPVWTPGSYRLRDFPDRITPLGAIANPSSDQRRDLRIESLSRTSWQVENAGATEVSLRYRVDLQPNDRFMDPADTRRCLTYEGPAVYLLVRGHLDAPCEVRFVLPAGWSVGSGLPGGQNGVYAVKDYDELADCPVKLGRFQTFGFQAHGTQIDLILDAGKDVEFDSATWTTGLQRMVEEAGAVFGGLPVPRYAFLFTAGSGGGGGLEHLYSTAIGLNRNALLRSPASTFGICAHEFFHIYNVKRLRPIELGPFRYDRPNRTTGLWLSEGVTSYYTPLLLARAGLQPPKDFWQSMGRSISSLENNPARHYVSSEQASLRVWDKQAPDRNVDYYGSGTVLGLLLDLEIRAASRNEKGLDDAMLAMWQSCRDQGHGLTSEDIERICSRTAGADLAPFFDRHVRGVVVPDYARILGAAGMKYEAKERDRRVVLRGADLSRKDSLVFRDCASLETSGGGDPLQLCGKLKQLDNQDIADAAAAQAAIDAGFKAGKKWLLVEYETATGSPRSVRAALEEQVRWTITVEEDPQASTTARALRESMTKARFASK